MHLTIDLDVLHNLLAVGFQSTVEVVQVLDTADFTGSGIEELGGNGFRYGVVTLLLIARHQVVVLFHDHAVELGNLVGRVLQVGIHRDDDIPLGLLESAIECGTLAIVTAEADSPYLFRVQGELFNNLP